MKFCVGAGISSAMDLPSKAGYKVGGQYEVIERIDQGGLCDVYHAERLEDRSSCVLRGLREFALNRPDYQRCFDAGVDCARFMHECDPRYFPEVYEVVADTNSRVKFMVMEFILGQNLADVFYCEGPIPEERAVGIALQIVEALQVVHDGGFYHADVDPTNVVVAMRDRIKLLDFDLAIPIGSVSRGLMGKFPYMAPEIWKYWMDSEGNPIPDQMADLYSFGVLLYEMLVGKKPFDAEGTRIWSSGDYRAAHLHNEVPDLPENCSPEMNAIVRRLLSKRLAERYASAREVIEALRRLRQVSASSVKTDAAGADAQGAAA